VNPGQNVRDTSKETYKDTVIPELSQRRRKVLKALIHYEREKSHSPTYSELKQYMLDQDMLKNHQQQIQPRLTDELVEAGFVEEDDERRCKVTGENVNTWTTTQKAIEQHMKYGPIKTSPEDEDGVDKLDSGE
jgi:hypothetical protein